MLVTRLLILRLGLITLALLFMSNYSMANQDDYRKALKYLSKNEIEKAKRIHRKLGNYPLTDYLDFHFYRKSGNDLTAQQAAQFMAKHEGSWLAERMRKHWINTRITRGDYQSFIDFYDPINDKTHSDAQCFLATAYFATGRTAKAVEQTKKLWLTSKSQPDRCDDAFDQLKQRKLLTQSMIFQRLLLSYESDQWKLIRYLQRLIVSSPYKFKLNNLHRARKNSSRLLAIINNKKLDEDYRAMVVYIVKRQAKMDVDKAYNLWTKLAVSVDLPKADHSAMLRAICSRSLNITHSNRCLKLAKLRPDNFPVKAIKKQIEYLLTVKNWSLVQQWIEQLPDAEKTNDKWQYWLARSHQYTGRMDNANQLFDSLSDKTTFHGFLSAIHLNKKISISQKNRTIDPAILKQLRSNRKIQRALALHTIGHSLHSRQEWLYAMKQLNPEQLLAAAEIGAETGWPYASISAMTTAKLWDEIHYRFPMNHYRSFKRSANKRSLNVSWLLGLSRKESNFIPDIQSYAGAIGVMQVMPATGKEMAGKIKIPYRLSKLSDPATNIKLGSAYLDLAYDTFNNNPAYASAAYNAGIYRIKTWLDDERRALPIDIWTDTIPNQGVQDYVRSVMQFSVFYADKLGIESSLFEFGHDWFSAPEKKFEWE